MLVSNAIVFLPIIFPLAFLAVFAFYPMFLNPHVEVRGSCSFIISASVNMKNFSASGAISLSFVFTEHRSSRGTRVSAAETLRQPMVWQRGGRGVTDKTGDRGLGKGQEVKTAGPCRQYTLKTLSEGRKAAWSR